MALRWVLLALLVASVYSASERNFGLSTIRWILVYYSDQMSILENEFGVNVKKFLMELSNRALKISQNVGNCVRNGTMSKGAQLMSDVHKVLSDETNKILEILQGLNKLSDQDVNKLWTSVSSEGSFRNNLNGITLTLKRRVFDELDTFKQVISAKCLPLQFEG